MAHILNMRRYPRLDQHKIPYKFEYTDKLFRLLMRIAETKPYLEEYLGQPLELQLLRQAKILAVTYSNQIEGNKLEVRGVTQILESKKSRTSDKDIIEVRNYSDALDYVEVLAEARREKIISFSKQKKEFTLQDILNLLPDVPRRTVQRDLEALVREKKIKAKGDNKARAYFR